MDFVLGKVLLLSPKGSGVNALPLAVTNTYSMQIIEESPAGGKSEAYTFSKRMLRPREMDEYCTVTGKSFSTCSSWALT